MKKLFTVAVLAFAANQVNAQQNVMVTAEVVAPSGAYMESPNGDISLSTTVGELVISTVNPGVGIILTQGFQQPEMPNDPTAIQTVNVQGIDMQVYPNPFVGEFYTVVTLDKADKLTFAITDLSGKTVTFEKAVSQGAGKAVYTFDTSNLAQGLYHLSVRNESGSFVKTLKVSKVN